MKEKPDFEEIPQVRLFWRITSCTTFCALLCPWIYGRIHAEPFLAQCAQLAAVAHLLQRVVDGIRQLGIVLPERIGCRLDIYDIVGNLEVLPFLVDVLLGLQHRRHSAGAGAP